MNVIINVGQYICCNLTIHVHRATKYHAFRGSENALTHDARARFWKNAIPYTCVIPSHTQSRAESWKCHALPIFELGVSVYMLFISTDNVTLITQYINSDQSLVTVINICTQLTIRNLDLNDHEYNSTLHYNIYSLFSSKLKTTFFWFW